MIPIGYIQKINSNLLRVECPNREVTNLHFDNSVNFPLKVGTPYPLYFYGHSHDNYLIVYQDLETKKATAMGGGKLDSRFLSDFISRLGS